MKLLLIDGMATVYRAYYALNRNPRINSKGLNTSCILGFTTTFYDLLRQHKPSHMAVCFDLQKPTFRHEMYAEYKAHRDAMPEEIQTGLPYVRQMIEAFNVPIITCEGYEADDVIGTLAFKAEAAGFDEVLMVTPDKDFGQLVTPHIKMYRFGRMGNPDQVLGEEEIKQKFGISHCSQVKDLLGLWGDASDNIPGIPGVGEKTAKKLIDQFGSIENMVAHVDEIKNAKLRELVRQHGDQALFSKLLATIALDAPVTFDEEQLRITAPNYPLLRSLCEELEFRNFAKKVFTDLTVSDPSKADLWKSSGISSKPSSEPSKPKTAVDLAQPSLFDAVEQQSQQIDSLQQNVPSVDSLQHETFCLSIYFAGDKVAVATDQWVYCSKVGSCDLSALRQMLQNDQVEKVCFDLKNLKYLLRELDITLTGRVFDVQLVHYLLDPERRHTLDYICGGWLNYTPQSAEESAVALMQLHPLMCRQLSDIPELERLYTTMELPLVDVLMAMQDEGVRIDVEALSNYSQQLSQQRDSLEHQIYDYAGHSFNIGSPRQLGEVLYDELKVTDKPPRTATKQYSTAEDALLKLHDKHPIIDQILEYRSLSKLIGTYLDSFPKLINPITHRLHTVFNQTVTATGRLSSSNPNLQNIPIRTERGREIRRAFVPRNEDYLILAADYSQIELRIIASLAQDRHMLEAFNNHYDIHAATAAKIYGIPIEEVTKEQRRNSKSVNFGIVYGISAFGLSEQLGIARKEASALIDEYFAQYPDIKAYIDQSVSKAHELGYAQTMLGRRRYLTDINSRNAAARNFAERNAVNMPIQGSSADMIKLAMIGIHRQLQQQQMRSRMLLQVHDELVFDVYRPEEQQLRAIVEKEMKEALPLKGLDIEVGIDVGVNWLEAH